LDLRKKNKKDQPSIIIKSPPVYFPHTISSSSSSNVNNLGENGEDTMEDWIDSRMVSGRMFVNWYNGQYESYPINKMNSSSSQNNNKVDSSTSDYKSNFTKQFQTIHHVISHFLLNKPHFEQEQEEERKSWMRKEFHVVIIGNGNVALDIARILTKSPDELEVVFLKANYVIMIMFNLDINRRIFLLKLWIL